MHAAHKGIEGMQSRAMDTVFWPGITKDLEEIRARCRVCNIKKGSTSHNSIHSEVIEKGTKNFIKSTLY